MDWQRHVAAADGYLDLGMVEETWDELDSMSPQDRARSEVILMRLVVLQSMARWDKAAEIARGAVRAYPDGPIESGFPISRELDDHRDGATTTKRTAIIIMIG